MGIHAFIKICLVLRISILTVVISGLLSGYRPIAGVEYDRVDISPATVDLLGKDATFQLIVTGVDETGTATDLTHSAQYTLRGDAIVSVSRTGVLRGLIDGETTVVVSAAGRELPVPVRISRAADRISLNFEHDIIPILSRYRCNNSGCHGKAEGQNGFKLSVFGFDATADYNALAKAGRGRRVFPGAPEQSLVLRKISGDIPHGGGVRISPDRPEYRTLRDWIQIGLPWGDDEDPVVTKIEMFPNQRVLRQGEQQQLRVEATMSDGRQVDVTELAQFRSNSALRAMVNTHGLVVTGEAPGVAAVMASYMGSVDVFRVIIPGSVQSLDNSEQAVHNAIDIHVNNQLNQLRIHPSGLCDDQTFLRRVFLDLIGTLPTSDEARRFLADERPDRRARLVEELMRRPEFADYWAVQWSDLLRVDRLALGHEGAYEYYSWIHKSFANNTPMDEFARELLTAEGPLREVPAGQFYRAVSGANKMASTISQVMLGVRIECAECHHHPWDRWSQHDYFGMQAYFTQVGFKGSRVGNVILARGNPSTNHPRTGEEVFAHPLGESMSDQSPPGDRRRALADWMTSADNPWFARNIANRTWAHFLGQGIVEPVDDARLTNPPSNPDLLDTLADYLIQQDYDFRELIRFITASAAYQRSSVVNDTNDRDEQNYSRFLFKQLDAEVLMDAISQATGVPEKFAGVPFGRRAIELWDSSVKHYFLQTFGRPTRATACECERIDEVTVSQVLHMLNSPRIQEKLVHQGGNIKQCLDRFEDNERLVEELYLTFYSRFPDNDEAEVAVCYLADSMDRTEAATDIAWSMMNSMEFLFNH